MGDDSNSNHELNSKENDTNTNTNTNKNKIQKHTRCRTGCLRCRTRRRKCDETKPRCRNCIDKGLTCRYGVQVTFLEKNLVIAGPPEGVSGRRGRGRGWRVLKFVNEDLSLGPSDENTPVQDDITEESQPLEHERDGSGEPHPIIPSSTTLITERDRSAIHGLLALGVESSGSVPDIDTGYKPRHSQVSLLVGDGDGDGNGDGDSSISTQIGVVSEDRRLQLLCYYRYWVASWLDICDLDHPFGITAVQMAMGSEGVMGALLGLSEVCVLRGAVSGGPGVVGYEREYDGVLTSEVALMEVLWEVKDLVVDVSRGWTKRTITGGKTRVVESLVHRAFSPGIEGSVYWLFVRLGLSVALANDEPIQVQLPLCSMPDLSTLSRMENVQDKTRTYAHIILWLCGNALMVYHHQHAAPRQWLEVFEHLDQWYHLRPAEFQPMVDSTDGPGFPLLLFVNGAGILCNQLYHTAMLLLLQCKPRTALLNLQSPTLSPLWHAQRICGIAMNNDRRESWDPCLIASFLVAARRMTHEAQQTEILQGLERVGVITGWRVDEYLMQLREDWSLMGSAHV